MPAVKLATLIPGLEWLATAVVVLNDQQLISYLNPAAENLLQLSAKQYLGFGLEHVFVDPGPLLAAIAQAAQKQWSYTEQEIELTLTNKTQQQFHCTVTPVEWSEASFLIELHAIDRPLRVAREERALQQQQANRDLLRALTHEIKNPLGGIRGAAQLLAPELGRPELAEYTQVIISEVDRLQVLIDRLLSPHRMPHFRQVNIHEILTRVRNLILAEFSPGIRIDNDFDVSLPELECDPEQILQAVLNIVRNAAEAGQGQGTIRLKTRVVRQVTFAKKRYQLALSLSVEDNGPGIDPALRDKIFFPLVSGRAEGSGLGLSIAQTYITHHQGVIEWESVPGRTCFTIVLPLRALLEIVTSKPEGKEPRSERRDISSKIGEE